MYCLECGKPIALSIASSSLCPACASQGIENPPYFPFQDLENPFHHDDGGGPPDGGGGGDDGGLPLPPAAALAPNNKGWCIVWILFGIALLDGKIGDGAMFERIDNRIGFNPDPKTVVSGTVSTFAFFSLLYHALKKRQMKGHVFSGGSLWDKILGVVSLLFMLFVMLVNGSIDYRSNQSFFSYFTGESNDRKRIGRDILSGFFAMCNVVILLLIDQDILITFANKCREQLNRQYGCFDIIRLIGGLGLATACGYSDYQRIMKVDSLSAGCHDLV